VLRGLAQREKKAMELVRAEHMEEIALILVPIASPVEPGAAPFQDNPRVVARRHERGAQPLGEREQLAQLDRPVAGNTGARGLARKIGVHKGIDDMLAEQRSPVEGVVRNPEKVRDPTSIVLIFRRATAALDAAVIR